MARYVGAAVATALAATIYGTRDANQRGDGASAADALASGLAAASWVMAVFSALGILLALVAIRRHRAAAGHHAGRGGIGRSPPPHAADDGRRRALTPGRVRGASARPMTGTGRTRPPGPPGASLASVLRAGSTHLDPVLPVLRRRAHGSGLEPRGRCCVQRGGRMGWPVGRVLSRRLGDVGGDHPSTTTVAGRLQRSTRALGRAALERARAPRPKARGLLDLAPGGVYRATPVARRTGGLLHHRFTLAPAEPGAVCSLWHCPAGCPGWLLATTLPCGARTFLGAPREEYTRSPGQPIRTQG